MEQTVPSCWWSIPDLSLSCLPIHTHYDVVRPTLGLMQMHGVDESQVWASGPAWMRGVNESQVWHKGCIAWMSVARYFFGQSPKVLNVSASGKFPSLIHSPWLFAWRDVSVGSMLLMVMIKWKSERLHMLQVILFPILFFFCIHMLIMTVSQAKKYKLTVRENRGWWFLPMSSLNCYIFWDCFNDK